jgi:hypothetical protein
MDLRVVGGSGIHVAQGGLGLTATLGGASVLNIGGERRARPNLIGDPVLPDSQRTVARWFNTDAFQPAFSPSPQAFGTAGVGIMRGPGVVNFDFTFSKNFNISERRYSSSEPRSSMHSITPISIHRTFAIPRFGQHPAGGTCEDSSVCFEVYLRGGRREAREREGERAWGRGGSRGGGMATDRARGVTPVTSARP